MLYVNPVDARLAFPDGLQTDSPATRKAALREFERLFLYMMLKEMRKTVPVAGEDRSDPARETFEDMFDDALAGEMARSGQIGVARQLEDQLAQRERGSHLQVGSTWRESEVFGGLCR